MSNNGIRLELKGTTFKFELLQIVGGVIEAAAKALLVVKTGGAAVAVAPNLVTGLFGALKGIKLEETPELRAWLLVSGGLLYALEKSISETNLTKIPGPESFKKLIADIGVRIQTRTYTVEPDFFSSPNRLVLLDDVAHELSAWSSQFGGKDKPKNSRAKIDKHFPSGLHRTWMKKANYFEPLELALNSPFASSVREQQEFDGYRQYLEEQFTQLRLIGQDEDDPQAITLPQVFLPLRAYVEEQVISGDADAKPIDTPDGSAKQSRSERRKKIVHFFESLDAWIASPDRRDALRIVSGGPGIGKSSTMRAFAARAARSESVFPVLIPLQKLERPDQPLRDRIKEYLVNTREIPFKKSPLDTDGRKQNGPFLLIFDGLDELVRPGKDADEVARDFMIDLRGLLEQENGQVSSGGAQVLAIVTGRVASAGSAARALKCTDDQILFLIPFAVQQEGNAWMVNVFDPNKLLDADQRLEWWELWRSAAHDVPEEIPERLLDKDLFDVTVEPLLLYFVAFVQPWNSANLIQNQFGRNWLYDRLLQEFYARECSKGIRNFALEFKQFEDYELVLQAMALTSWYDGSTRTGTIDIVEKLLRDWSEDIAVAFKKIIGSDKPAVGAALSFYMKPGEIPNSFEFLHKTFAEYLVARRAVDTLDWISSAMKDATSSRPNKRRPLELRALLVDWLRFAGPRAIDDDLLRFLDNEVARRYSSDPQLVIEWRSAAAACLRAVLREGFQAHLLLQLSDDRLTRRPQTFRELVDQSRNAEESLLAILHATILPNLSDEGFRAVRIGADEKDASMGWLLTRIRGQRMPDEVIALELSDGLDFSGENLRAQDLIRCRARKADFSRSNMWQANCVAGEFDGSNFSNANLVCADFSLGSMQECSFLESKITLCAFERTNLIGAKFLNGSIESTSMKRSKLSEADFSNSDIATVNFEDADLTGANFEGAKIFNTNFKGADLTDTKISKAQLASAKKTQRRLQKNV